MENLEGSNNKYHCTLGNSENNFEKILPIIKKLCNYLGKKNFRHKITVFIHVNSIQLKDVKKWENSNF